MNLREIVKSSVRQGRPILGVGPMSENCVDAALDVSRRLNVPLFLIASRRQIDSKKMGGGYVNNWTTESFAKDVLAKKPSQVFLCRDHGGPWQNPKENKNCPTYAQAYQSALESFKTDIDSGFDLLHIDPIYNVDGSCVSALEALERAAALQAELAAYAQSKGRRIEFEFGTEDQNELPTDDLKQTEYYLESVDRLLSKQKLSKPLFSVFQTGTKVLETENCGAFPQEGSKIDDYVRQYKIRESINLIRSHDIEIKEHNGDFLSDDALRWRSGSGIGGLNVAPEFGHVETRTYLELIERLKLPNLAARLEKLADESGKWRKWTNFPTELSSAKRTIIAGHYLFTNPQFKEIRAELQNAAKLKNIDLDSVIKENIANSIVRYLSLIGWL